MYFSNPPRPDSAPTRTNWKRAFADLLANEGLSTRDRAIVVSMHDGWSSGAKKMTTGRKSFFYLIQERTQKAAEAVAERQATGNTEMGLRLAALDSRISDRSSWDAGFVESLIRQEAQASLSLRQIDTLEKIEARHTDEIISARQAWRNGGYGEAERTYLRVALTYYAQTQYFMGPRADFFADDNYIPSFEVYDKIVNNQYARKVIAASQAAPKYAAGLMVSVRSTTPITRRRQPSGAHLRPNVVCIVISTSEPIISAAKGCKRYKVLPVGSAETFLVEERDLKIRR